jgi:hypothetical protein
MRKADVWRTVFFCLFVGAGLAALTVSILADEMLDLYLYKVEIQKNRLANERLQKLSAEYDSVIKQIEDDPNILTRLAGVSLGIEPNSVETAYPRVPERARRLAELIMLEQQKKTEQPSPPAWLLRCTEPLPRTIMFLCSVGLIITSFVCFGTRKHLPPL